MPSIQVRKGSTPHSRCDVCECVRGTVRASDGVSGVRESSTATETQRHTCTHAKCKAVCAHAARAHHTPQCQVCARGPRAPRAAIHIYIHRRSSQQTAPHVAVCRHHVPLAVTRGQRQVYTIRAMQASPMASAACGPPPPPPRLQMRPSIEFAHANAGESPGPVSTVSSGWAAVSSLSL